MSELYAICRTSAIADSQAAGFVLARAEETGTKPWPILITRKGNKYGFENACPHEGVRLDASPGQFLEEEENFLTCGQNRAQFDLDTGHSLTQRSGRQYRGGMAGWLVDVENDGGHSPAWQASARVSRI